MKVAYDHQIFAVQTYGGISRYFHELSDRLAAKAEVVVAAPLYVNRYLGSSRARVRGLRVPALRGMRRLSLLVGDLSSRLGYGKADILHETYYGEAEPHAGRRAATVHDMIPELGLDDGAIIAPKRRAIERADLVICVSQSTRRDLLERIKVPEERVRVIYHGSELIDGSRDGAAAPRDRPFVLHVGRRADYKNFSTVLAAYAASERLRRDLQLVCFGGGPFTPDERELIGHLGLAEGAVVHLAGDDTRLAALYRQARLYVSASRYEGFGMPVVEAMSAGCPVCCSLSGSLAEVAGGHARLFDPADVEAVREAMECLAYDDTGRAALLEPARVHAGGFTWDRCAAETLSAYRDILG